SVSSRNRDIRPMDRTPTIGQKSSSKKKNTLRAPMSAFRSVTAQTASSSFRQLNEDLLELRLAHLHVADDDAVGVQRAEQLRQPLLGLVHRALDPPVDLDAPKNARNVGQPRHPCRVQPERDDLAETDLALELAEEEELGIVHERLGEGHPLLQPGRQIAVRDPAVRAELAQLDQSVDASVERRPAEAVEPPVERDDLGDAQAPEERRAAARHVEPAP